jgi:hypothetical protein
VYQRRFTVLILLIALYVAPRFWSACVDVDLLRGEKMHSLSRPR